MLSFLSAKTHPQHKNRCVKQAQISQTGLTWGLEGGLVALSQTVLQSVKLIGFGIATFRAAGGPGSEESALGRYADACTQITGVSEI